MIKKGKSFRKSLSWGRFQKKVVLRQVSEKGRLEAGFRKRLSWGKFQKKVVLRQVSEKGHLEAGFRKRSSWGRFQKKVVLRQVSEKGCLEAGFRKGLSWGRFQKKVVLRQVSEKGCLEALIQKQFQLYGWKGSFKAHAVKAILLNILAATQQSQNWVVKARGRSTNSTLPLLKNYHPLWQAALPSPWSKRQVTLVGRCFHGIWCAVFGKDRLKPSLRAIPVSKLVFYAQSTSTVISGRMSRSNRTALLTHNLSEIRFRWSSSAVSLKQFVYQRPSTWGDPWTGVHWHGRWKEKASAKVVLMRER